MWIMIPMVLHFMCAEQKNMTNAETAQSPEVKKLVLYTTRYTLVKRVCRLVALVASLVKCMASTSLTP